MWLNVSTCYVAILRPLLDALRVMILLHIKQTPLSTQTGTNSNNKFYINALISNF